MLVISKLEELNRRYEELGNELARPEVIGDPERLRKTAKEQADLDEIVKAYRSLTALVRQIEELEQIISDGEDRELVELALEDIGPLRERRESLERELAILLLPKDPNLSLIHI